MPSTVDGNIKIDENPWASKECTKQLFRGEGDDDEMVDVWNPDRPVTDIMSTFIGKDVGLPRRWLPHASVASFFGLMLAQCVCLCVCVSVCLFVCVSVRLCVCVSLYIYIYNRKYTYI